MGKPFLLFLFLPVVEDARAYFGVAIGEACGAVICRCMFRALHLDTHSDTVTHTGRRVGRSFAGVCSGDVYAGTHTHTHTHTHTQPTPTPAHIDTLQHARTHTRTDGHNTHVSVGRQVISSGHTSQAGRRRESSWGCWLAWLYGGIGRCNESVRRFRCRRAVCVPPRCGTSRLRADTHGETGCLGQHGSRSVLANE